MTETYAMLTSWLATYLIHSTIALSATFVLCRWMVRSPALQETLWKSAVVLGIVSSVLMTTMSNGAPPPSPVLRHQVGSAAASVPAASRSPDPAVTNASPGSRSNLVLLTQMPVAPVATVTPSPEMSRWVHVVPLFWLAFALVAIGRIVVGHRRFMSSLGPRKLVTRNAYMRDLAHARDNAGFRGAVCLTASSKLLSPLAIGSSEIAICEPVFESFTHAQRVSILAHEIAHLSRRDPAWRLVTSVINAIFFFQPLNFLASRKIIETAEFLADGAAAADRAGNVALAESLVAIAREMTRPNLRAVALAGSPSMLHRRIQRLLGHARYPRPSGIMRAAGVAPLIVLGAFAPEIEIARSPSTASISAAADSLRAPELSRKYGARILDDTELMHTHETDGRIQERTVLNANHVLLTSDGRGYDTVLPGGRLEMRTTRPGLPELRLVITAAPDETVSRTYWVGGRTAPVDRAAEQWFSSYFTRLVAQSGT